MNLVFEILKDNWLFWSTCLAVSLYLLLTINHRYWSSRNVIFFRPAPLFGNSFRTAFSIVPSHEAQQEQYNHFSGLPYGGIWSFWKPKLMVRDPRLLEHIMIKDFSFFTDRDTNVDTKTDPLGNHLVNVNGNTWRLMRNKLTPVFSSGKLKSMVQQIIDCSDDIVNYIEEQSTAGKPLEVRDQMAGFTMDVIGSCAFGLNIQAVRDPDSLFRKLGKSIFAPSTKTKLRLALRAQFGFILRFIRWGRMPKKYQEFFVNTVKSTLKYREENNVHRNDFIQLMMEIRKDEENHFKDGSLSEILMTDTTITANAFVFLLAGYETTATTLGYMLYELSENQDIQEKVYNEVVNTLKRHKGELNWDTLKDMTYIEQVISETLRKHPPVTAVARKSVKPYKIPNSDLELPEHSVVVIPVYSIHHDPQYYPEPERFNPDRFSEENKHKLVKCTFLPFGEGPRICIGLRFAKVEMKVAIVKLIMKYKFNLNSKTITPLKYSPQTAFLVPIGGIWVNFVPRVKANC